MLNSMVLINDFNESFFEITHTFNMISFMSPFFKKPTSGITDDNLQGLTHEQSAWLAIK